MVKLCRIGGEEQSHLPSTGLIINGVVWVKHLYHVHNKSHTNYNIILNPWSSITSENHICWCVQSHPEDRGDFGQGSTANISECNNQPELSVYNMWCSYMVLTNPHMRPRIEFIIMKIFMKILKICPKSPRFTVQVFMHVCHSFTCYRNISLINLWYVITCTCMYGTLID